jgi:outer membrane protein assembly factor BamB
VVYVGSSDGYLYALDASTGSLIWGYQTGHNQTSSPAVSSGVVYVGSVDYYTPVSYVYALDASTGDLIWRYHISGTYSDVYSSPAVAGGVVYVGSNDNYIYALVE